MNALRLDGVMLDIDGKALFEPLGFSVEPGNVTSVVGPSGSGKSSLLAYLCGILPKRYRVTALFTRATRN